MTPEILLANLFSGFDYVFTPYLYGVMTYLLFAGMVISIIYIAIKK